MMWVLPAIGQPWKIPVSRGTAAMLVSEVAEGNFLLGPSPSYDD